MSPLSGVIGAGRARAMPEAEDFDGAGFLVYFVEDEIIAVGQLPDIWTFDKASMSIRKSLKGFSCKK